MTSRPAGSSSSAELGLGLAALGRPGYITLGHGDDLPSVAPEAMRTHAHLVLDAAYEGGIRYLDAARSYGRAEEFLGSWLRARGLGPDDVHVASKWGYTYTAGWRVDAERHEVKDLSAATLRRQLGESRALLGPYLHLYQIHSATLESRVLDDAEVLAELRRLRAEDLTVGLTVTGPEQAATLDRALEVGAFDAVQATWNLLERSTEAALERAHAAGLRVVVKEALANGRLTPRGAPDALSRLAAELATTPDALALAAALARPWADVVLSGAATVEQLRANLDARRAPYDEALEPRLRELVEDPEAYWERRSSLVWN